MKNYLKEVIISLSAIVIMSLAVVVYFKAVKTEQSNRESDLYALLPPNAEALLAVNRPDVFNRMMLSERSLYQVFASEIPDIFLALIRSHPQVNAALFSFHSQGVLCCIQAGRVSGAIEDKFLPARFGHYLPQKHIVNGIDFYYYPDTENRFFGYYINEGIWVGSYSRKLLEHSAEQQFGKKVLLPQEMTRLLNAFDTQSPANIVYPLRKLGIHEGSFGGRKWLGADLFVSEGSFCCYTRLPYYKDEIGETIAGRVSAKYPPLRLSFQVTPADDSIFLTACSPLLP